MDRNEPPVLLVGVSARWLLESAARSSSYVNGLAIDRFADWDSQQIGSVSRYVRFDQIPQIARALATRAKPDAILIGGGFESHPAIADELRTISSVANLPTSTVRYLRNPSHWTEMFLRKGIATPSVCLPKQTPDGGKSWLVKGICSGGGNLVRAWTPGGRISNGSFLQESIRGNSCSALLLFEEDRYCCLGYFRQIIGRAEFGARGFQFCGAIGPLRPQGTQAEQLERIGSAIATAVQPKGLIGVDLIERNNELIPIEINPRPTATCDLWERLHSSSLVQSHLRCFGFGKENLGGPSELWTEQKAFARGPTFVHGKAILHWPARNSLQVNSSLFDYFRESHFQGWMSDIPNLNTTILFNEPIVTVYASAIDEESCFSNLLEMSATFYGRLGCEMTELFNTRSGASQTSQHLDITET